MSPKSSRTTPSGSTRGRDAIVAVGLVVVSALAVATTQSSASRIEAKVKESSDVYLLPPPEQLDVMSLGYRSALADILWADVLVVQGLRLQEKRRYSNVVPLLESVIALDPQFREPYLLADTLITFQRTAAPVEEVRTARKILEMGVKNRPLDAELWLILGQFTSFIAPASYLKDEDEKERWRHEGLPYLERAVELAGPDSDIAWLAVGGASAYRRLGERDASIRFYQKVLATTDDEELKADVQQKLEGFLSEEQATGAQDRMQIAETTAERQARRFASLQPRYLDIRRFSYAGLPRSAMLAMGPPRDPALCAGGASASAASSARCAFSWIEWAKRTTEADASVDSPESP